MSVPLEIHYAVAALVEPNADPELSPDEVDDAIARTAGYARWAPSTVYAAGAFVIPTVANGWAYAVATPGTSGAMEPIWEVPTGYRNPYARVADNTVTWLAAFPAGGLYDVKAAAAECLRVKARKAMNRVDSTIAGAGGARESQMYRQLMDAADRLEPARLF